jgi:1-acyl-sn-glycerol-3-phosphate acyltransferase
MMLFLRSAAFHLYFFGLTTGLLLFSLVPRALPAAWMRGWPHTMARRWAQAIVWGLRVICGTRYEVSGRENLPAEPVLIASMHQSTFDTVIWLLLLHEPAYVLKIELMRIPLFSGLCRWTEMIVVDRAGGAATIRSLLKGADRVLAQGRSIVIFPEGTRVAPGVRGVLHPGIAALATHTRLAVVPVLTDSGFFWGRRTFLRHPGVIRIVIQKPLPVGTRRPAMMTDLADRFAAGLPAGPVENSVGTVPGGFTRSGNSEP